MYRDGGYQRFSVRGMKFYAAVTIGAGRRRYSRAKFRRARDAQAYSARLVARYARLAQGARDAN